MGPPYNDEQYINWLKAGVRTLGEPQYTEWCLKHKLNIVWLRPFQPWEITYYQELIENGYNIREWRYEEYATLSEAKIKFGVNITFLFYFL